MSKWKRISFKTLWRHCAYRVGHQPGRSDCFSPQRTTLDCNKKNRPIWNRLKGVDDE